MSEDKRSVLWYKGKGLWLGSYRWTASGWQSHYFSSCRSCSFGWGECLGSFCALPVSSRATMCTAWPHKWYQVPSVPPQHQDTSPFTQKSYARTGFHLAWRRLTGLRAQVTFLYLTNILGANYLQCSCRRPHILSRTSGRIAAPAKTSICQGRRWCGAGQAELKTSHSFLQTLVKKWHWDGL